MKSEHIIDYFAVICKRRFFFEMEVAGIERLVTYS